MDDSGFRNRRQYESLERPQLCQYQLTEFNRLLETILPRNDFYARKLDGASTRLKSLEQLTNLPLTTKEELQQEPDFAVNRTFPLEQYSRFHRTSGTHGRPMIVVDTPDDWRWWIDTWQYVLDAAAITPADRVLMAFSFGPFVGFWSANDALAARGAMVIPTGGLSTLARLELLKVSEATVVCCTPSYALRLAEAAQQLNFDVSATNVSRLIVAGEPGGSIPAVRQRIENAWKARVVDHSGATEIGPWGYADASDQGLHVVETEFIAEFLALGKDQPAEEGELSELVLTTLHRIGCPVIRYRTGDLVRHRRSTQPGNQFVFLDGGVLGRADDMVIIRGMNIFPSAVEQILCGFSEVVEYRITASRKGEMDTVAVEVEDRTGDSSRIAQELKLRLGLNVEVTCVPLDSLPRFEGKGKRFVDLRKS